MAPERPEYAVIFGQGRSGTVWLLGLFDLSPATFCRNEPGAIEGSPFSALAEHQSVCRRGDPGWAERWDQAVQWTSTHMGERDRRIRVPKHYLWPVSRRAGLYRAVHSRPGRRWLSIVSPDLRNREWELPRWVGSRQRLAGALTVLKLFGPGWASFVLHERPAVPVIHIVRHPCGFLNSWRNRYLAEHDATAVTKSNRDRLHAVVEADPSWADRFGRIDALTVDEAELWYWVYANETIHRIGMPSPNYHRVLYEDLATEPLPIMRRLWDACGLEWTRQAEAIMAADSANSHGIRDRWKDQLSPELVQLAERVLGRSSMGAWWR